MDKIEQIKIAIENAIRRKSKITDEALNVPGLMSLNIRHLLNNLANISTVVCDHGSHVGGSFCSMIVGNNHLKRAIAIDSWKSDDTEGKTYYNDFLSNVNKTIPEGVILDVIKEDSFSVPLSLIKDKIDLYYYDASHDEVSQREGLLYYLPALADEFIFCVDDYMLPGVKKGTQDALQLSNCEVLFEKEFITDTEYDNESFWRGWYLCYLKKIK